MNQSGNDERFEFFYNLRAVAVIGIIIMHGLMTYSPQPAVWQYIIEFDVNWMIASVVSLIDVPVYFIILFVAGYFVYPTILQQNNSTFLLNKIKRKGLPWIVGVLLFTPPVAYLLAVSENPQLPYSLFLESHFWAEYYQQSVYWILGVLLLCFGCVSILYSASISFRSLHVTFREPTWGFIAVFITVMSIGFFIINQSIPKDEWVHFGYLVMVQPVRVPLYIGYFFLGLYAFKNGWFRKSGYIPELQLWLPLACISAIAYLTARLAMYYTMGPQFAVAGVTAVTFNMFCYSSVIALIAVFRKYLNKRSLFWDSQAKNAYAMFYLHPLVLYPLALYGMQTNITNYILIPAIIIVSWLVVWILSEAILTRAPALRELFLPHK